MCPVPLCSENNPWFNSEEELEEHLNALHPRSVLKNGLEDLLAFAETHPGEWYLREWRRIDEETERVKA